MGLLRERYAGWLRVTRYLRGLTRAGLKACTTSEQRLSSAISACSALIVVRDAIAAWRKRKGRRSFPRRPVL